MYASWRKARTEKKTLLCTPATGSRENSFMSETSETSASSVSEDLTNLDQNIANTVVTASTSGSVSTPLRHTPPTPEEATKRRKNETFKEKKAKVTSMAHIKSAARKLEKNSKKDILKRLEGFFKEADTNKDGYLTMSELTKTLRRYGFKGSDEEIAKFFDHADASGDQRISLDEYLRIMKTAPVVAHSEANMRRVFNQFDKDGNGSIDKDELKEVFDELGEFFPAEEVQKMIDMADEDESGCLEYEEFIEIVSGRRKRREFHWPESL